MKKWYRVATLLPLMAIFSAPVAADTVVKYNKDYVEDAIKVPEFDIADKFAVLSLVLAPLPQEVKVYPTENYFYFYFDYKGIKYSGNLRFDVADRDKGIVHFNYFKDFTAWQRDEEGFSAQLSQADGVTLKKLSALSYELSFKSKTVRFDFNDMSLVKPPEGVLLPGETYIGPVYDESAIRFFLIFNKDQKTFHYILDETVPVPDQFNISEVSDRISIGIRTGFAFYDDRFAPRKILIGVNQFNTSVNNYLDGPFDQLPDNFIEGDVLKNAILAATPDRVGLIDRLGNSPDGETRYLIAPYMTYEVETELSIVSDCARTEKLPSYYSCFSFAGASDPEEAPEETEVDAAIPPEAEDDAKQQPAK